MQPQLISAYIAVIILTLITPCSISADTCNSPVAINLWKDLVNYSPPQSIVSGLEARKITIQKIQDATGATVNLDHYKVQIDKFPTVNGKGLTGPELVAYVRKNLHDFVDTSLAQFVPYQDIDKPKWTSDNPIGAVISIYAKYLLTLPWVNLYAVHFGVACAEANNIHWRFVTLRIADLGGLGDGLPFDGHHPVSGTREFGLENGNTFYTRGSDRTTTFEESADPGAVYGLGDQLWKNLQTKVAEFVNSHGGKATILSPIRGEISWDVVQTCLRK